MRLRLHATVVAYTLAACSSSSGTPASPGDAGEGADSSAPFDASAHLDARGTLDSAAPVDAPPVADAAEMDAGAPVDAASEDVPVVPCMAVFTGDVSAAIPCTMTATQGTPNDQLMLQAVVFNEGMSLYCFPRTRSPRPCRSARAAWQTSAPSSTAATSCTTRPGRSPARSPP